MGRVATFEHDLQKYASTAMGCWYKADLHNHTPTSFDYRGKGDDIAEQIARQIAAQDISVVMFADHERLPDPAFVAAVQRGAKDCLILRGVELNVFVNALDMGQGKIEKEAFYHLLIGFDPDGTNSPEYWLEHLYRECGPVERTSGSTVLKGVETSAKTIAEVLSEANAIVIPAHLHTLADLARSRSVDDIFGDRAFLQDAERSFTALEVVNAKTADFFDGQHQETNRLRKTCIRSSDSHEPDELGRRTTWVQLEQPTFAELKAALELPFRVRLSQPEEPEGYIVGMRIRGAFFPDQWIAFSPHCNMLIAVKGSGKTSVLECLRFALGSEVPASKRGLVAEHLQAILGAGGQVDVLVKRADGARVLVQRRQGDSSFQLTFDDDREERLSVADGLGFPTHILGWHEIEQAATDAHIRRVYMDSIAGKARVRAFEEEARALSARIHDRHTAACQRFAVLRETARQVDGLEELRKGLQVLTDANLIDLRSRLQSATEEREAFARLLGRLRTARTTVRMRILSGLGGEVAALGKRSEVLAASRAEIETALTQLLSRVGASVTETEGAFDECVSGATELMQRVDSAYASFLQGYEQEIAKLRPDQRRLLESHREVLEQTKQLGSLQAERDQLKAELTTALGELAELCDRLARTLDARTALRKDAVDRLNKAVGAYDVRVTLKAQQRSAEFDQLSSQYGQGAQRLSTLRQRLPARLASLILGSAYGKFAGDFDWSLGEVLFDSDIGYFISAFENDDLQIALKVGKAGEEFSPIDQLSAGQRCTAVFPILLEIGQGVLVLDQPEDNLDNRHIATKVAPALLARKQLRQMIFTSHNANLVVLSDAEAIIMFESDGARGRVEAQGYFATAASNIAKHVMDVLDGGEKALELRAVKYGLGAPH